jgi:dihydroorotase
MNVASQGAFDWAALADRMSVGPARIGRVSDHGRPLAVGEPAHLTLVAPDDPWVVSPSTLGGLSTNSPFLGRRLSSRVVATFLRGRPTMLDGKVLHP